MDTDKRISDHIDSRKECMLNDIARLVAIPSVRGEAAEGKPFGEMPAKALSVAEDICREHGLDAENIDNYAVVASLNKNDTKLGILAHLDVVAEGDGWTDKPFEMKIDGNRIIGRGVADNKGPAVAALYAMEAAKSVCPDMKFNAQLILGSAEETGSEDIAYLFSKRDVPPAVFSPDADYPLINTEKGRCAPVFTAEIKDEKPDKTLISFDGGKTANVVPWKAEAVVAGFDKSYVEEKCVRFSEITGCSLFCRETDDGLLIHCDGKNAHAAQPHTGNNAQTALLAMLADMDFGDTDIFLKIKTLAKLFPHGDTFGKAAGVDMTDETAGELTLNFGVLNIVNNKLDGCIDIRYPCKGKCGFIKETVGKGLADGGIIITGGSFSEVHHVDENSDFIKELLGVYEEYTGNKGECLAIGGGTYVHNIDGGVAFGCAMPGVDNRMHAPDEFAYIDDLVISAKMFARIIIDMCS